MLKIEKWKQRVKDVFARDCRPGQIAAGLAVGVFIGCTPLYGLQTLAALGVALVFRIHKPACMAGLWIQNPVTAVPIIGVSYKLGCLALGVPSAPLTVKSVDWQFMKACAEPFLVGSVATGLLAAVPTYCICYLLAGFFVEKGCARREDVRDDRPERRLLSANGAEAVSPPQIPRESSGKRFNAEFTNSSSRCNFHPVS